MFSACMSNKTHYLTYAGLFSLESYILKSDFIDLNLACECPNMACRWECAEHVEFTPILFSFA